MPTNSVLLVDDEALIRKSLANQIRQQGYAIDTAASGEEALRKFDAAHYDLLILDLARIVRIDKNGHRFLLPDCVRNLDLARVRQIRGHEVLCNMSRRVRCTPVHFGWVFS